MVKGLLTIERIFDAPRELVWKAITEAEHLKKWWGPKVFTAPLVKNDFKTGGTYLICMQDPDGKQFWAGGVYKEIIPMEKIVTTDYFSNENGEVLHPNDLGFEGDWSQELIITWLFEDYQDGKTRMTLIHEGIPAGDITEMTKASWNESFDKLADSLTK